MFHIIKTENTESRKYKWILSVLTGMLTVLLFAGTGADYGQRNVTAWWGSIYPSFCFAEADGSEPPKISFWLAKALERW